MGPVATYLVRIWLANIAYRQWNRGHYESRSAAELRKHLIHGMVAMTEGRNERRRDGPYMPRFRLRQFITSFVVGCRIPPLLPTSRSSCLPYLG